MTKEKGLFFILVLGILIVFGLVFWLFFAYGTKSIRVLTPNGGEEWEIGKSYEITWQSRGIDKVGIILFHGKEPKWIAKDIPASRGKYEWKIYPGQEYGSGFWVAVVEYPWREDNKIDYSDFSFAIIYSIFDTCESLSASQEWLYLPSNFPNLRRVFITEEGYSGNLDGLEGADRICQEEAERKGYGGAWQAFLGGDGDEQTAVERLENTPRGKEGIFVQAESGLKLERGDSCFRVLAKDFSHFLTMFSNLEIINKEKLEDDFLQDLGNIWLGRLDEKSKKNCLPVDREYSFTVTCQNWTQDEREVEGSGPFPNCYTPSGKSKDAVVLGALSLALRGKEEDAVFTPSFGRYCSNPQKLLCIEK